MHVRHAASSSEEVEWTWVGGAAPEGGDEAEEDCVAGEVEGVDFVAEFGGEAEERGGKGVEGGAGVC